MKSTWHQNVNIRPVTIVDLHLLINPQQWPVKLPIFITFDSFFSWSDVGGGLPRGVSSWRLCCWYISSPSKLYTLLVTPCFGQRFRHYFFPNFPDGTLVPCTWIPTPPLILQGYFPNHVQYILLPTSGYLWAWVFIPLTTSYTTEILPTLLCVSISISVLMIFFTFFILHRQVHLFQFKWNTRRTCACTCQSYPGSWYLAWERR